MNQTRIFLFFAWLFVAYLVWDAWTKDTAMPPPAPAATVPGVDTGAGPALSAIPDQGEAPVPAIPGIPVDPGTEAPVPATAAPTSSVHYVLATDVLRLRIDAAGGAVRGAELLAYRQTSDPTSPPVALLSTDPAVYHVAELDLVTTAGPGLGAAPVFSSVDGRREFLLAEGQDRIEATLAWRDDSGLEVVRTYALERGSYALTVRDEIRNNAGEAWVGYPARKLERVPPIVRGGSFTNPEALSFAGATWHSPQERYNKIKFDNFRKEAPLDRTVAGGWIAMQQHHFLSAWVPNAEDSALIRIASAGNRFQVSALGPQAQVAPGASRVTESRLWIGPKLQDEMAAVAPGLELTVDYGIFTILSKPLHWVLSLLYSVFGNWGWSIIGLVVLIKLIFFKLSEIQYKSFARMRAVQPRIESLKERYGDDRQKFQMAMMELYKKEKINPMGGCLPILVQIPVFIALYWVLLESVELRHAPWMGWIQSLTDRDPYFILPIVNMLTMWATQKLTPMVGMDPLQKKMMMAMPLVFGVLFAFFPAGLVLYWATNGALGLLQQWVMIKRHGGPTNKPAAPAKA